MSKILLVEDDDDIRDDLAELLMDEGYRVVTATNGQEAWEELQAIGSDPCVILLDLMMPVMSGWDFRQRQLSDPRVARVPVVVMTGVTDAREEAQRLQAIACIEKPLDLERLFDALQRAC